jgi:hypothetical protein
VLATGTHDLPTQTAAETEPVLVEAARRLDPPRLRRVIGHLQLVADPDGAQARAERHHQRRGLWLTPTLEGMVAVDGLLEPEAGQTLLAALEPQAAPPTWPTWCWCGGPIIGRSTRAAGGGNDNPTGG